MPARPTTLSFTPDNVNLAGFAALQTTAGAGSLTLAASTNTNAVKVALTSAGNISAVHFVLTGTDANGKAQTESMVGPSGNTVYSTKYYLTITSITVDAAVGTNTEAGWDGTGSSGTALTHVVPLNFYSNTAAAVSVEVTGTINYTVQETFDPILLNGPVGMNLYSVSALASKTSNTESLIDLRATGVQILINSYSNGATLNAQIIQNWV